MFQYPSKATPSSAEPSPFQFNKFAISTEANNIPINLSAPIICKTIKSFINSNREEMKGKTIVLCCPHRLSVSQSGYLI